MEHFGGVVCKAVYNCLDDMLWNSLLTCDRALFDIAFFQLFIRFLKGSYPTPIKVRM